MNYCDFSEVPRNFVHTQKVSTKTKGVLKIEKLEFWRPLRKILIFLWFNCENTSLLRLIMKEDSIKHISTLDDAEAEFFVEYKGEKYPLLAYDDKNCALLIRVFTTGDSRSGKEGWVEFANGIITENGKCKLFNQFLSIEHVSDEEIGEITCSLDEPRIFEEFEYDFSRLEVEENIAWHSHSITFLNKELTRVLEPEIGYHKWKIPRSCFYLPNRRASKFDEDWLECNILFSFYLHRINADKIGNKSDIQQWNKDMTAIVEAFTYFVTRMDYQPDMYNTENLDKLELEIFSKQVFTLGCGDCEDVAYTMMEIFLYLRNHEQFKSELLNKVSYMLKYYFPVNVLVQANAPEMSSSKAKISKGRMDFDPQDLKEVQRKMSHFHMVGMLIPTAFICNSLMIEGEPKKWFKRMTGFDDMEFGNKLSRLYFEGTVSVHADPDEVVVCEKEVDVLTEKINNGDEIFKCYILNNYENASIMYGGMVQFVSPLFYKYIKTTIVTLSINQGHEFYFAPVEYYQSDKNTASKIRLHPSTSLEEVNKSDFSKSLKYIDPPNPILHINKIEFKKKLAETPKLVERLKVASWDTTKKHNLFIEYLPYNMTDESSTNAVNKYFILLCPDKAL